MQATPVDSEASTQTGVLRPYILQTSLGLGEALILRQLLKEACRYAALTREESGVANRVIDDLDRLLPGCK